MEPCRPECLVGVDVPDPGEERLVEQERLEPTLAAAEPATECPHVEGGVERLRSERREHRRPADLGDELARDGVAPVQPDPAELADVAEADLAAIGQLEDEPDVRILRRLGRDHEQLAGHLEVDGQRRLTRQLDHDQLRAPPDALDPPSGDRGIEGLGRVRAQCPRPRTTGAGDRRAEDARAQVARHRLDLG